MSKLSLNGNLQPTCFFYNVSFLFRFYRPTGLAQSIKRSGYPIQAESFIKVQLADDFWLPRPRKNTDVTIPASFQRCETTNRVKDFEMAAAKSVRFVTIFPFDDTDIYKGIEGASYSLKLNLNEKVDEYMNELIKKIAATQEPNGYFYTARTIDSAYPHECGPERFSGAGLDSKSFFYSNVMQIKSSASFHKLSLSAPADSTAPASPPTWPA